MKITTKHKISLMFVSTISFLLFYLASTLFTDNPVYQNAMDIFIWSMPFIITGILYKLYLDEDSCVCFYRKPAIPKVEDSLQTVIQEEPYISVVSNYYDRRPYPERVIYVYGYAEEELA